MLIDLRKAIYHETRNLLFEPWEYSNTVRQEKRYIERYNQPANSCLMVAAQQRCLVGLIGAMGGGLSKNAHAAQLFVAVRQSHWRQGIGRELIQAITQWAPAAGLHRLSLNVATDNLPAYELYKSLGFVAEGVQQAVIRESEDTYRDELTMALLI